MELRNKRVDNDTFHKERKEVLASWPTGKDVNFEEAIEFQKSIPEEKIFGRKLAQADAEGRTLIQPRAGVALYTEHIRLLQFLEEEGGADLLPSTVDSYTRLDRYHEAEDDIIKSKESGRSMFNGFPIVNCGTKICRTVTSVFKNPVQVRHGTSDMRLLTEISIAGGFTSYEGGGILYNILYSKNSSPEKTIMYRQYTDRLVSMYEEVGVSINREPFSPLTDALIPPCISSAVAVIETLLTTEQGVKDITAGHGQCGNVIQDVAAVRSLRELINSYFKEYGYDDVRVMTVFHQWMGGFSRDETKAFGVVSWGLATAALAKATKVIVKTLHEAMGVLIKEVNAAGLRATKQVISTLHDQSLVDIPVVEQESDIIVRETKCILDKVFELGKNDLAVGTVAAFEVGMLDIPFAPSRYNAGKVLPARDDNGAVRILDTGHLPFMEGLKTFHREKLEERSRFEHRPVSFQMVIDDVYAIGKSFLVGGP